MTAMAGAGHSNGAPRRSCHATIVVPTIREASIGRFLELWEPEFRGQRVIVVEDNPDKTFALPTWVEHYCWEDIDRALQSRAWIIPRRSDCVRSFGYYLAAQSPCDFVVTLDDDCYPEGAYDPSFLGLIAAALDNTWVDDRWWNTLDGQVLPRGYPYDVRRQNLQTVVHHGLWSNVPDLDAKTQMSLPDYRTGPVSIVERVPHGRFFPMCGMNLAFRPAMIPALYFLLMGKDRHETAWPYDRFGDIWAGVFVKKVADHLGLAISSGGPSIFHSRASNPEVNLQKETPGYPVNELLWRKVESIGLTATTVAGSYAQIAENLDLEGDYWTALRSAMKEWAALFATSEARSTLVA
jgi:reversibly glycosylated polypeptide / UDP-arabinopyranose mutase